MEFTIRSAREEDAAAITGCLNPIIEAGCYTIIDRAVSLDEQQAFIRDFPERGVFLLAVDAAGQVLGLQSIEPVVGQPAMQHVADIATFVHLECHRHGIGQALTAETFRLARERGFRKIMAMIRADNPRALAFYQSQGFKIIGTARQHSCVRDKYLDEIFTECHLHD